jgi:hypothetical protein
MMMKKILLATLLTGFIGILIWGGVNRTLAKSNSNEGQSASHQSAEHDETAERNGVQQRGNGNQGGGKYAQNEIDEVESFVHGFEEGADQSQNEPTNDHATELVETAENGLGRQGDNQGQSQGNGSRNGRGNGNGPGDGQGGGYEPLTKTEIEALHLALDDEYHALAVYQSIIASFGEVEPFVEIAASEQRHIEALTNQLNKHQLDIPENPWIGKVPVFESVQMACKAGVEAEIANAELYDQLFSMTENSSLIRVFTNLSNASVNSHLPQFEACQ